MPIGTRTQIGPMQHLQQDKVNNKNMQNRAKYISIIVNVLYFIIKIVTNISNPKVRKIAFYIQFMILS